MKTLLHRVIATLLLFASWASAQTTSYTNFIRQVQYPSGVQWDASVPASGQQESSLAINPGGARFELWTVESTSPPTEFLLASSYVGTYVPLATVVIRSEDGSSTIPRTRADRPFYVDVTVSGLLSGAKDPTASKSVNFLRHLQSYGVGGTGVGINRGQASLYEQSSIKTNGAMPTKTVTLTLVPGADRSKVRGEERFSVFTLDDYQAPASQIAGQYIQIWPVADGTISGIAQNQLIRFAMPQVTLAVNDLYPTSTTYAQVYRGEKRDNVTGVIVTGSAVVINDSIPQNRVLSLANYDDAFDGDGRWTMELLTKTPFGIDRLAYVSFDLDRTIQMNGTFTTIE